MDPSTWLPTSPGRVEVQRGRPLDRDGNFLDLAAIENYIEHPEGGCIFYDPSKNVIARHPLNDDHISVAKRVLDGLRESQQEATIVLSEQDSTIEYYVVLHTSKQIVWAAEHTPPLSSHDEFLHHDWQYWCHMRNFPGPRHSRSDDHQRLKRALENQALHVLCPNLPFGAQYHVRRHRLYPLLIESRLGTLQLESSLKEGIYGTFSIANMWLKIIEAHDIDLPPHPLCVAQPGMEPQNLLKNWLNEHEQIQPIEININDNQARTSVPIVEPAQASPETTVLHETLHNISHTMTTDEITEILCKHGCKDVTSDIDPPSQHTNPSGRGGFGHVFEGEWYYAGRSAAPSKVGIKFLIPSSNKVAKLTAREVYAWAKCRHLNILELIGVAKLPDGLAMVSPWMDGGNLRSYSQKHRNDQYKLYAQVSDGVAHIHRLGLVHGDLKCDNIVVSADGIPKITDFGATVVSDYSLGFTAAGMPTVEGTWRWKAPETLEDVNTTQSDVYSLGMTILEAFTGSMPFLGISNTEVVKAAIQRGQLPNKPPMFAQKGQPYEGMWDLLLSCWEFDPPKRPAASRVGLEIRKIST